MRKKLCSFLLIFIFYTINFCFAENFNPERTENNNLKITIEFVKNAKIYHKNEPVKISFIFNNHTNSDLIINKRLISGFDILFSIKRPSGKYAPYPFLSFVGLPKEDNFFKLSKKSSLKFTFDLTEYTLDETGKYSVKALYQNQHDGSEFGLKAWTGEIESNTLEFRLENMVVTKNIAVEIANKKAKELNYDIKEMQLIIDDKNTE